MLAGIKFGDEAQIAIAKILADINVVGSPYVLYVYMRVRNLGGCKDRLLNHQIFRL